MGDTWQNIMAGGFQSPAVGGFSPSSIPGSVPIGAGTTAPGGLTGDTGAALGWNMGTGRLAMGALGTAGSLWQSWNANQLAQKTFNFQKDVMNTNLRNSIQSYNTQLEDRARSRAVTEGQTDQQRQEYVDRNRLTR